METEVASDSTGLPSPPLAAGHHVIHSTHDSAYWAKVTRGMDFSAEDRINFNAYNHILWEGLKGSKPYPAPTGLDLRSNRRELLDRVRAKEALTTTDAAKPPATVTGGD